MQGRAFNGHYLTWIDMAHTETLISVAGSFGVFAEHGIDFVVAAAELQFEVAARLRDEIKILKRELRSMEEAGV